MQTRTVLFNTSESVYRIPAIISILDSVSESIYPVLAPALLPIDTITVYLSENTVEIAVVMQFDAYFIRFFAWISFKGSLLIFFIYFPLDLRLKFLCFLTLSYLPSLSCNVLSCNAYKCHSLTMMKVLLLFT